MWEIETWKQLIKRILGPKRWATVLVKGNPGKLPRGDGYSEQVEEEGGGDFRVKDQHTFGELCLKHWGWIHTFLPWLLLKGRVALLHCTHGSLFPSGLGWTWITCPGANGKGLVKQPGLRALCSPAEEAFYTLRTFHQVTTLAIICHWYVMVQAKAKQSRLSIITAPKLTSLIVNIEKKCLSAIYHK